MSTPIEIVRELVTYRGMRFNDKTQSCITTALASVLADAERFKALELAAKKHDWATEYGGLRSRFEITGPRSNTLAELADRLREEKK